MRLNVLIWCSQASDLALKIPPDLPIRRRDSNPISGSGLVREAATKVAVERHHRSSRKLSVTVGRVGTAWAMRTKRNDAPGRNVAPAWGAQAKTMTVTARQNDEAIWYRAGYCGLAVGNEASPVHDPHDGRLYVYAVSVRIPSERVSGRPAARGRASPPPLAVAAHRPVVVFEHEAQAWPVGTPDVDALAVSDIDDGHPGTVDEHTARRPVVDCYPLPRSKRNST